MANGRDDGDHAGFPAAGSRSNNTSAAASAFNMHSDYMPSAGVAAPSEMSAMVTALTHVVSSEPQNGYIRGGGIASSSANLIQTSTNSPPSSAYSSTSSGSVGRKRRLHHEDYVTEFSDNVQSVYHGFGDSFSAVKSGFYFFLFQIYRLFKHVYSSSVFHLSTLISCFAFSLLFLQNLIF